MGFGVSKKRVHIIDFGDSFVWNISSEFVIAGADSQVHTYEDSLEIIRSSVDLVVLGPGPGNIEEYRFVFEAIQERIENNLPTLGICLGHQLIHYLNGEAVVPRRVPVHGQVLSLDVPSAWRAVLGVNHPGVALVQQYNSWTVRDLRFDQGAHLKQGGEVWASRWSEHVLSVQFHPESVATSFRSGFFTAQVNRTSLPLVEDRPRHTEGYADSGMWHL